ncbi:MAG: metallophosphoesterase [Bacteroidota bacterium]
MYRNFSLLIIVSLFWGCGAVKTPYISPEYSKWEQTRLPDEGLKETIFLLGDTGEPDLENGEPVLELLGRQLKAAGKQSTVIFLGDNLYPDGLPKKKDPTRALAERKLGASLDAVIGHEGNVYFIPGNHDWNGEKPGGRKAVKRFEDFIQDTLKIGNEWRPNNACADPEIKKIDKDFVVVFIDSQWWLHDWDGEKKMNKGCEAKSKTEFLVLLEEKLQKYKKDQILIVLHHPFFSNGNHGSHFSAKRHLFPFTGLGENLWIPLPILGSAEPVYRKITGTKQDITHANYQELKNSILGLLDESFKNVIFAAGHDHNLQYFRVDGHHHIVSGAGSKHSYVRKGLDAGFAYGGSEGFVKLYYYKTREVWMEFVIPDPASGNGKVVFRKQIVESVPEKTVVETDEVYDEPPARITMFATKAFKVGKFSELWMGKNYRKVWETPVTAPSFKLADYGLSPIKKGGGNGTTSLRLEDKDGKHFVLRSVNKNVLGSIPEEFRDLKVIRFYTNFNASNHPYAALPIPTMAEAAGIYYANPKLVYLPHQKELGIYNQIIDEGLYFFEERPAGDRSELDNFGNSEEIIGYIDLLRKLRNGPKHRIDQSWVLKSRLFDIFIHDWDRHDDQWRWAVFKQDGYKLYRPIPRDRDASFYKFNGPIPKLISALFMRKLKSMKGDLKDAPGQSTNAAFFDRHFLNEMDRSEWDSLARELQVNMTDEVIEKAFEAWQDTLFQQHGEEIIGFLKSRRDKFPEIAVRQYKFLAKRVDVIGTDEEEYYEIERLEDGFTRVRMYESNKDGDKKDLLYDRLFDPSETQEIRLQGLGGQDEFHLSGDADKGILIRIIGGFGKDRVYDNSSVSGMRKLTRVYDESDGIKLEEEGTETKAKLNDDLETNEWNREYFRYNTHFPLITFGFTEDDGFSFGAGIISTLHGFRKDPHSAKHSFSFSLAPQTGAFNVSYGGEFIHFLGKSDFLLDVQLSNPENFFFYGLSNMPDFEMNEDRFYQVRSQHYQLNPKLRRLFVNGRHKLSIGPSYAAQKIVDRADNITRDPAFGFTDNDFEFRHYLGAGFGYSLDATDGKTHTRSGIRFNSMADYRNELGISDDGFFTLSGDFTFYFTLNISSVEFTVATRVGTAYLGGDYQNYQTISIGGNNFIRGLRNDRFRGDFLYYHNTDLRISLFEWDNRLLPFEFGLLGGIDYGRIRQLNDQYTDLQKSYTVGIWFNPLEFLVITPFMSFSDEDRLFSLQMGFSF